jgi:hypothetical protein
MATKKKTTNGRDSTIAFYEYLSDLIDISPKTQRQIADEIGYEKPNVITMFKQGLTKVPLEKVAPLARALNADPVYMLRLAMSEYMPETLTAISEIMGYMVTPNEREMIDIIREASNNTNPRIKTASERKELEKWASSLSN